MFVIAIIIVSVIMLYLGSFVCFNVFLVIGRSGGAGVLAGSNC